jgi:hypothetical protein
MVNIHFNVKNVRVLVYVFMESTHTYVKIVMEKVYVNIIELNNNVKNVAAYPYVSMINAEVVVQIVKVEVSAPIKK